MPSSFLMMLTSFVSQITHYVGYMSLQPLPDDSRPEICPGYTDAKSCVQHEPSHGSSFRCNAGRARRPVSAPVAVFSSALRSVDPGLALQNHRQL
jgi:hypothetical protein